MFWRDVVEAGRAHGIEFVVVTNRPWQMPVGDVMGLPVVYCHGRPKKTVMREGGLPVSIWVDDMPWLVHFGDVPEPAT